MGHTLGANFLVVGFTFSLSLGDGLSTGPTTLQIDNYEMAAVVKVVFIYQ